jgi:mono/diheme cytochrome c family protein
LNRATLTALFFLLFAAVPFLSAQDSSAPSILKGVFTKEQVARGQQLYVVHCSECHGEKLIGGEATGLTGVQFRVGWVGKTLGERFDTISKSMPASNPQALNDQEHLDVITYILNFNGYPTGSTELKPDMDLLNKIKIEPQPASTAK